MIIGISGKIISGKDTVGSIIQYLTHCENDNTTYEEWCNTIHHNYSNWKIKKFGSKLKDIVCLLLNCTREQLEDREFKEEELGEEWWYYKSLEDNSIILQEKYDSFPDEVGDSKNYYTLVKTTPKLLLQLLGTECGREILHPNIWVNALMSEYKSTGSKMVVNRPNWIVTDVRFPNELKAVKDKNSISIRVNKIPTAYIKGVKYFVGTDGLPEHKSETALDEAEFDYTIENNETILELIQKVKQILIQEKII